MTEINSTHHARRSPTMPHIIHTAAIFCTTLRLGEGAILVFYRPISIGRVIIDVPTERDRLGAETEWWGLASLTITVVTLSCPSLTWPVPCWLWYVICLSHTIGPTWTILCWLGYFLIFIPAWFQLGSVDLYLGQVRLVRLSSNKIKRYLSHATGVVDLTLKCLLTSP